MRVVEKPEDRLVVKDNQLDKKLGISAPCVFLLFFNSVDTLLKPHFDCCPKVGIEAHPLEQLQSTIIKWSQKNPK